jgi:hypothetical protein
MYIGEVLPLFNPTDLQSLTDNLSIVNGLSGNSFLHEIEVRIRNRKNELIVDVFIV